MAKAHEIHSWKENEAHRGQVQQLSIANDALGAGASMGLVIKTDGLTRSRLCFSVAAGADGRVMLYEDPTLSSSTLAAACNMNRRKASTVGTTASFGSAPVFAKGSASVLFDQLLPGGTGVAVIGNRYGSEMDWILDSEATYIISACNKSAAADLFSVSAVILASTPPE